jgi:hypothetical protein
MAIAAEIQDDDPGPPPPGAFAMTGQVVDEAGKPVAGARVVTQEGVIVWPDAIDPLAPGVNVTVTGADGGFSLARVSPKSVVVAGVGARRARPVVAAPRVTLRLVPTGSVRGTLVRSGTRLGHVQVALTLAPPLDEVTHMARIAADGSWQIDDVPRGKATVVVTFGIGRRQVRQAEIVIGAAPAGPVKFEVAERGVPVHLVIRSDVESALSYGMAFMVRGTFKANRLKDLDKARADLMQVPVLPAIREDAPTAVRPTLLAGDVLAQLTKVEPGEISICAMAITGDITDQQYMDRVRRHAGEQALTCMTTTVTTADQVIVLVVPPMKRLPE